MSNNNNYNGRRRKKNGDTIDKSDLTPHFSYESSLKQIFSQTVAKSIKRRTIEFISFILYHCWWWQTAVNYKNTWMRWTMPSKVLVNAKWSEWRIRKKTYWKLIQKTSFFNNLCVWMVRVFFPSSFFIFIHNRTALGKPINHTAFFVVIFWWRFGKISLSFKCKFFFYVCLLFLWFSSPTVLPSYSSLSSIIYVANIFHRWFCFSRWIFVNVSHSYSYLLQILMQCFYLVPHSCQRFIDDMLSFRVVFSFSRSCCCWVCAHSPTKDHLFV